MATLRSVLGLLVASLALPIGCGNDDGSPVGGSIDESLPTPELVCPVYSNDAYPDMAPLATVNAASVGAIDGAFSMSSIGSARYAIPLTVPPARRAPQVSIVYDSHAGTGPIGKGFGMAGLSAIHRCGSNLAQDDRMRGITLSSQDHYCLDGSRLVQIATGKDAKGTFADFRAWPDQHIRVRGYGAPSPNGFDVTYFERICPMETKSITASRSMLVWFGGAL